MEAYIFYGSFEIYTRINIRVSGCINFHRQSVQYTNNIRETAISAQSPDIQRSSAHVKGDQRYSLPLTHCRAATSYCKPMLASAARVTRIPKFSTDTAALS